MRLEKLFLAGFYFVLATVPLLFGARHPLIHGFYSCLLLLAGGGWLIVNTGARPRWSWSFAGLAPVLLLLCIVLTSISLPSFLLRLLSPVRAGFLESAVGITPLPDAVTSLSYYAPAAMFHAVYGAALLLFFYAARDLLSSEEILRKALWTITLVGLFEAAYGLLQATNPDLGVLWLSSAVSGEGNARGTIIYRNQYAAFMNLCWPLALALGISLFKPVRAVEAHARRRRQDLPTVTRSSQLFQKAAVPLWSAGLMILAVIFSRSRGGILVMVLTAGLFLSLLSLSRRLKALIAGGALLFICFYGGIIGFDEVIARFTTLYESSLVRFNIWQMSLAMLRDHPLAGIGMGAYGFLSPVYLREIPASIWYDRAHNEYVELAIELGIPLMLLFLAWTGWGMFRFAAAILRRKNEGRDPFRTRSRDVAAIGAFCAVTGLLLHGWLDFPWRLPAIVIYAVVLLAMLGVKEERGIVAPATAAPAEDEAEQVAEFPHPGPPPGREKKMWEAAPVPANEGKMWDEIFAPEEKLKIRSATLSGEEEENIWGSIFAEEGKRDEEPLSAEEKNNPERTDA